MEGPGWEPLLFTRLHRVLRQMMTLQVVPALITVAARIILQGTGLEEGGGITLWELLFYLRVSELS